MHGDIVDLYERYDRLVGKFILSFLRNNRCIAPLTHFEGIKSSIFLRLTEYLKKNTLDDPEHFLLRSSKNACISHFRKLPCLKSGKKIFSLDNFPDLDFLVSPDRSDQERIEMEELQKILHQAISSLTPKYKDACDDLYMELSHKQIAEKRNISAHTSKKNRQWAIRNLRKKLKLRGIINSPSEKGGKV